MYGCAKNTVQKTCEVATGSDSINIDFLDSSRQFNWLEIYLVFNKSNKHVSFYDSYNAKLAAKYIKLVKLLNKEIWHGQLFLFFFFYQRFLSWTLTTHRTAGGGRGPFSIPLYHFHSLTNIQTFMCNFAREMTFIYF